MLIRMTTETRCREAKKRRIQIRHANAFAGRLNDVAGVMALATPKRGMAALKRISGFAVIEFVPRCRPTHDVEVLAVVFRVAPRAIQLSLPGVENTSVISVSLRDQIADCPVAMHAPQFGSASTENVAFGAFERPIQTLVRAGKSPRGDLTAGRKPGGDGGNGPHSKVLRRRCQAVDTCTHPAKYALSRVRMATRRGLEPRTFCS